MTTIESALKIQTSPDMAERLLEAQRRCLWQNLAHYQQQLIDTILEIDNSLEVADWPPDYYR
jgi:cobalamin biosynthesis Mg chelatase CobN